jgi:hypothetical protein
MAITPTAPPSFARKLEIQAQAERLIAELMRFEDELGELLEPEGEYRVFADGDALALAETVHEAIRTHRRARREAQQGPPTQRNPPD